MSTRSPPPGLCLSPSMYNSFNRLQTAFGFFTTVAFVVAAIIAASDFTVPRTPGATIKPTNVTVYVFTRTKPIQNKTRESDEDETNVP